MPESPGSVHCQWSEMYSPWAILPILQELPKVDGVEIYLEAYLSP